MFAFKIIIVVILSGIIAQAIKIVSYFIEHRKINFKRFFETGGMPSSHASTAATLTTIVGLLEGFNSLIFCIVLFF